MSHGVQVIVTFALQATNTNQASSSPCVYARYPAYRVTRVVSFLFLVRILMKA